jgi:hypothetical protein
VKLRRCAGGLVLLASLAPHAVHSTTATSLGARIAIDGVLDEYAPDEWVLDSTSAFPESDTDSRWGSDADVARVALTWDDEFLYVAVDFRSRGEYAAVFLAGAAGGLTALDGAGSFRRAIDLPGIRPTLLALAVPHAAPSVAMVDAFHPFGLVDRATLPAAVQSTLDGRAGFEMAIPWARLSLEGPVRLVSAITGGVGSGSGDAAPDPRATPDAERFARARLDRVLAVVADADADGRPDAGVSPRAVVTVETSEEGTLAHGSDSIEVRVDARAFAPDRAEVATFTVAPTTGEFENVSGSCTIYSVDGREVREFSVTLGGPAAATSITWDGRDAQGRIVPGGVFVAAFDLEFTGGAERTRARATIGVAVVR